MKKSIIIIIAVVAVIVIWAVSMYNGLVTMDESVNSQWANVETQYQRRADLIPNLVNTVKGYASHEKETLEGVVEVTRYHRKLPGFKSQPEFPRASSTIGRNGKPYQRSPHQL